MEIDVEHVAKLANLPLDEKRLEILGKLLIETLLYIERLNEIPTEKSVEDAALMLEVLAGHDPLGATSSPLPAKPNRKLLQAKRENVTIGIADDYFEGVDPEMVTAVQTALQEFERLGHGVKRIKLFDPQYAIAVYTIIQRSEVSSNLARYDGIRYGCGRDACGEEAQRRIMLGTYSLSAGYYDAYYAKAQKVRTLIVEDFARAFEEVDVVIGPTSPSTALPAGSSKNHPLFGEVSDALLEPSIIAGLPGISICCGFSKECETNRSSRSADQLLLVFFTEQDRRHPTKQGGQLRFLFGGPAVQQFAQAVMAGGR